MNEPTSPTHTDELAQRLASTPEDMTTVKELWRETFQLERWWFVPAIGPEDAPAAVPVHGQKMLLGFTTRERAVDFARAQGFSTDDAAIDGLSLPPIEVVTHVSIYQDTGVEALIMDADTTGYFALLSHLRNMWGQLMGPLEPLLREPHEGEEDLDATGESEELTSPTGHDEGTEDAG
jgi:hypothetical protein